MKKTKKHTIRTLVYIAAVGIFLILALALFANTNNNLTIFTENKAKLTGVELEIEMYEALEEPVPYELLYQQDMYSWYVKQNEQAYQVSGALSYAASISALVAFGVTLKVSGKIKEKEEKEAAI